MKSILLATIFISSASMVKAQTPTPDLDAGSLDRLDSQSIQQLERQPIQQPGVFSNPNNSSRQFFQQDRDNLYFLNESEPILQIDDENEAADSSRETEEDRIQLNEKDR